MKRSRENIEHLLKKGRSMPVDVAQWDATKLPFRSQCVDVIVSDLPFGKRIGSRGDNRVLYYHSLVEMARITRTETGRAVLLTYDRNSMMKVSFVTVARKQLCKFKGIELNFCR